MSEKNKEPKAVEKLSRTENGTKPKRIIRDELGGIAFHPKIYARGRIK